MNKTNQITRWFIDFFLYNFVFIFLQTLYIIFSEASFIHAISYPLIVYCQVALAFILQILLYGLLSVFQTLLLWGIISSISKSVDKTDMTRWQLFIYAISIVALLSINGYFFPLSRFSRLFLPALPNSVCISIMTISLLSLGCLTLIALYQLIRRYPWQIIGMLSISLGLYFIIPSSSPQLFPQNTKPNLLIISIDSFGPNQINPKQTPHLASILKTSTHFTEMISPLARTYPAWTSILTGLYPLHHHARENLYPAFRVEHATSFAWNLQRMGYRTIFASDERRFNNLGEEFGFQEIIGPRIGIMDILLGSFYDFPLSNLLINSRISSWLLPWNYTNRAGFFSYYPTTFDQSLHQAIATGNHTKPLLLAVHFSLPHWPYAFATSSPSKVNNEYAIYDREELYQEAIHRVDQQVGDLLHELQQQGALTNSVIIILSDHGEALYQKGTRKTSAKNYQGDLKQSVFVDYLKRKTATPLDMSLGHGSDLLSPIQYRCLFGIQINQQGKQITTAKTIQTRVALIDIAPTIADLFHFTLAIKPDGISLTDVIFKHSKLEDRFIMLESGMLANQSLTRDKLIAYAHQLFEVNPNNTLLEVRQNQYAELNAKKLYGVIYKNWVLALYPDDKHYVFVILNLATGLWTDNLETSFIKQTPFIPMLQKLRQFYVDDLLSYPDVPKCIQSSQNTLPCV